MTMLKRYYLLILFAFLSAACTHYEAKRAPAPAQSIAHRIKQDLAVSAFTRIDIQGQINVSLHTGYKKPRVLLSGDARDLAQIKTVVSQNTLYLVLGKGYPHHGPIYADIRGQFLNLFSYKGAGYVTGTQLHTSVLDLFLANKGTTRLGGSLGLRQLTVWGDGVTQISGISSQNLQIRLKGNPKIQLAGVARVSTFEIDGSPWFSMYWLKSDTLTLRAKKAARIQLAGTVNRLDVELWGNARFKGHYLRAQRSFIKTHGHSVAEISAVNHQSSLATDASDIYYYNIPVTRADFMAYDGSVLDMREWNRFDMEDFNRYNKQFP